MRPPCCLVRAWIFSAARAYPTNRTTRAADAEEQYGGLVVCRLGSIVRRAEERIYAPIIFGADMSSRTLCIGADIAWWGGSTRDKASQADHVWSAWIAPRKRLKRFNTRKLPISCAAAPLVGFTRCLGAQTSELIETIAYIATQMLRWTSTGANRSKAYDDVIDAGIALLTGVCLSAKSARWVGDGADGAILIPGHQ